MNTQNSSGGDSITPVSRFLTPSKVPSYLCRTHVGSGEITWNWSFKPRLTILAAPAQPGKMQSSSILGIRVDSRVKKRNPGYLVAPEMPMRLPHAKMVCHRRPWLAAALRGLRYGGNHAEDGGKACACSLNGRA